MDTTAADTATARRLIDAFNARDLDRWRGCFCDDVEVKPVSVGGKYRGQEGLDALWVDTTGELVDIRIQSEDVEAVETGVICVCTVVAAGFRGPTEIPVAIALTFAADGRIETIASCYTRSQALASLRAR